MSNPTVTTTDFYLAAYLFSKSIRLTGHIRENNKSTFKFDGDGIDELLNDFCQGMAIVSPTVYAKNMRDLKAIMYNGTTLKPQNDYDKEAATKGSE